jgi:hypothetical protein
MILLTYTCLVAWITVFVSTPSCLLRWVLANILPKLASKHDSPDLCLQLAGITGMSYCSSQESVLGIRKVFGEVQVFFY